MSKIVPIRRHYDNPRALLGAMLENGRAAGFVGVEFFLDEDGERCCRVVKVGVTVAEMCMASLMLSKDALEDE